MPSGEPAPPGPQRSPPPVWPQLLPHVGRVISVCSLLSPRAGPAPGPLYAVATQVLPKYAESWAWVTLKMEPSVDPS